MNFRDNPLTLDVALPSCKATNQHNEDDAEDEREMFGRDFMKMYIQEARKRAYVEHCVNRSCQHPMTSLINSVSSLYHGFISNTPSDLTIRT